MSDIKGPLEFMRMANEVIKQLPTVTMNARHFEPGTQLPVIVHNYYLRGGGMGDRICAFPCLLWTAKNCPYIWGRVWVADSLLEFARNIIGQAHNPNWRVHSLHDFEKLYESDTRITGRGMPNPPGIKIVHCGATGAGGHLVQMGWVDHGGRYNPRKGGDYYPEIDWSGWSDTRYWTWRIYGLIEKNFVVFTTGAVAKSRSVPGHYWNPLIDYVKARGYIPVFLGVDEMNDLAGKIKVKFEDGCNYSAGIDLRNQTTVMDAAYLMHNAAAVVGLDNGLIQLASCTHADIVCAYTIVDPIDRRPKRRAGKWEEIYLSEDELVCTGCQTNMPAIAPPHDFKYCLHQHYKCVHMLFERDGLRFCEALDKILS